MLSISFNARDAPIEVGARVVRVAAAGAGLAFDSIAEEDRRFLSLQILERSLAALHRRFVHRATDDEMLF